MRLIRFQNLKSLGIALKSTWLKVNCKFTLQSQFAKQSKPMNPTVCPHNQVAGEALSYHPPVVESSTRNIGPWARVPSLDHGSSSFYSTGRSLDLPIFQLPYLAQDYRDGQTGQ